jgi:hypothetical protein
MKIALFLDINGRDETFSKYGFQVSRLADFTQYVKYVIQKERVALAGIDTFFSGPLTQ